MSGIVVATHQHNIFAASVQQRRQKTEILPARLDGRVGGIEDVACDYKALRPEFHDAFPEPGEELLGFFLAVDVVHRVAQMPVGGVYELHVLPFRHGAGVLYRFKYSIARMA